MRVRLLALAGLTLLQPAAALFAQADSSDNGNIVRIESSNAEMAAAVRQARQDLLAFFEKMARPASGEHDFALKFNLDPKGEAEFIWADQLRLDNGKLTGVLTDDPLTAGYKIGQRVPIADADIIDWAYFKGRVAQGHVTTKVLLKQMSRDDANGVRDYLSWAKE
jgi:uncharacterized protein YegJ (DUF2314 family)